MKRLGDMNTIIGFEYVAIPQNDRTGTTEEWRHHAFAWCEILSEAGTESAPNEQTRSVVKHTLRTHYNAESAAITAKMRAVFPDGRVLPIVAAVNEEMRNRFMLITCQETT